MCQHPLLVFRVKNSDFGNFAEYLNKVNSSTHRGWLVSCKGWLGLVVEGRWQRGGPGSFRKLNPRCRYETRSMLPLSDDRIGKVYEVGLSRDKVILRSSPFWLY
jgi:hypothetical protein